MYKTTTLDQFVTLQRGFDLPTQNRVDGSVPVIAASGPAGFHNESKVTPPGVVLGRSGSIGAPQYVSVDFWPLNTTLFVKDFHGNNPKFVYYVLKTIDFKDFNAGGTVPTLNRNHLTQISVPNVGKHEQDAISGILGNLDAKIESNFMLSTLLERMSQTIFKSWFIDFDPVKAKMAGETPVGMDDATSSSFSDSMQDSELGPIPKGWSVQEFGEVNHLLMGQSPPGDTYNSIGEGVPFYQGRTDFGMRFPKERVFCTAGTRFAKPGEVLISVRAPVGDLNQAIEDCVIGRGVASAMHKSGSQAYSYALLCSLKPKLAYYNGEGTVFGAINRSDFNSLKIVEPPRQIVDSFEKVAGPFNDEIRNLFIQTESLIELRDSLLPRLISGELQIPEEMLVS